MTDQTRETLARHESTLRTLADWMSGQGFEGTLTDDEIAACEAGAAALRDVLTPRTCGNCQHADIENARDGWCLCAAPGLPLGLSMDEHLRRFPFCYTAVPLDERCKGWQAREGDA